MFVNGLNDTGGQQASTHGMGNHGGEDGVNKDKVTPMGTQWLRHPDSFMSLFEIMGAKSEKRSLCVERGRPR
jgi:hypothetical protein